MFCIARFVVEVPHPDTLVVFEGSQDILDVCFQDREQSRCVCTQTNGRVLYPTRVVDTWFRSRLLAIGRFGIPAVVEEDEEGLDMMLVGDGEVFIHVLFERLGFVLPNYATEIDAHEVEAKFFCPAEFAVDGSGIEGR